MAGMSGLPDGHRLQDAAPTIAEYRALRERSGLSPKSEGQARGAIANSWAFRTVTGPDGEVVAMGRIVGDGGWYFLVADMATFPEHQGRGLGAAVLDALLAAIREHAEPGAYVTLTADSPGRRLYESRGFVDVAPERTGMSLLT